MFEEGEVVRVLTAALMELLPEGTTVVVPKSIVTGSPEDERFCIQVDARSNDFYKLRVSPLTEQQRRTITGRTEDALRALIPEDWDVKINHYRMTNYGVVLPKFAAKRLGYEVEARGGFTEVLIQSPDGEQAYVAQAKCRPDENFCRAEGRVVALDRAVRKLQDAGGRFPSMAQLRDGGYPDGFGASAGAQS